MPHQAMHAMALRHAVSPPDKVMRQLTPVCGRSEGDLCVEDRV